MCGKKNLLLIIIGIIVVILVGVGIGYGTYKIQESKNEINDEDVIQNELNQNDNSKENERNLVKEEIKYSIVDEKNFNSEFTYYNSKNIDNVEYYFDSCLEKNMPTVTFEIIDGKLSIQNYYDDTYFLKNITNIKEFVIRTYQSNSSMYLILLTNEGEVYVTHLWGVCANGNETVITPEELEDSFIKLNINEQINSIGTATAYETSLLVLYSTGKNIFVSLD